MQKERVVSEAFRVLKPGGRFAVSDVVFLGENSRLPAEVVRSVELWSGCISGALEKPEYEELLSAAGFEAISVETTHTFSPELIDGLDDLEDVEALRRVLIASAFILPSSEAGVARMLEGNTVRAPGTDWTEEERVAQLVALGRALSDPIRVRMLGLMAAATAEDRGCCDLPELGAPVEGEEDYPGICVCEFMDYYGMGQSKVSYHLGKLKEAGLVREERRGKWGFYSLDGEAARQLLAGAAVRLGVLVPQGSDR